ncbi:hypothetical protein K435DRAFT_844494 [Dendrothele bispora CBS 962.96]|uniref:F-box domain-containing protein n=1 Tax=Dendrothele bispora (strain CBS 962.96) TaxID=1314807 RepID=A0A4S8L110_DENBC|nr:hypothetical protein K435DRAFT_844494 [Dendrothele bispora CBS 962.96]
MTTTTRSSAASLEDLPDELLHRIVKLLNLQQSPITIQSYRRDLCTRPPDWYPADSVSLVNRRLRRLSLPILFREISICLYLVDKVDVEQFQWVMEVLKLNTHLVPLIRNVSIIYDGRGLQPRLYPWRRVKPGDDPETLLIIDVLSRFTHLEHLDLPAAIEFGHNLRPILEALNGHPSNNIRLHFMSIDEWSLKPVDPELLNELRSMSLSRVVCRYWDCERYPDQEMKAWIAQGLNIESISRTRSVDDSWMDGTYPGLTSIYSWNGNQRSLQSTIDFLIRHPLLKTIQLDRAHECDTTPWRVTFASKMYPYSFKIVERDIGWRNRVVKIDGEWLYNDIKVIFQDDIAHVDVETVETMIRTLNEALPQPSDCSELYVYVGIDFLSPVGKYMTSDDLIGILARNMNYAVTLDLGKLLCDILTRESSQILEPSSAINDRSLPGFKPFCERLKQAMPRLRQNSGGGEEITFNDSKYTWKYIDGNIGVMRELVPFKTELSLGSKTPSRLFAPLDCSANSSSPAQQ